MIEGPVNPLSFQLTLGILALSVWDAERFDSFVLPPLVLFCVFVLGIPHGAIDHIVYEQLQKDEYDAKKLLKNGAEGEEKEDTLVQLREMTLKQYYWSYLALMAVWMLGWVFIPGITLLTFLGVTCFHWGQSDLHHLRTGNTFLDGFMIVSRGLFLVAAITGHEARRTVPVMSNISQLEKSFLVPFAKAIHAIGARQHFFVLGVTALYVTFKQLKVNGRKAEQNMLQDDIKRFNSPETWFWETVKVVLLWLLYNRFHAQIALCIYFGIWHSTESMLIIIKYLKKRQGNAFTPKDFNEKITPDVLRTPPRLTHNVKVTPRDAIRFLELGFLYTLISVAGMVLCWSLWELEYFGGSEDRRLWSVFSVGISVVTAPHVWIIGLMHRLFNSWTLIPKKYLGLGA